MISIELAARRHLAAIPGIEQAAATMFPVTDLPAKLRYRVTANKTLREAQAASRLWVALTGDGKPVGYAMANIVDGRAHLDEMDVAPDYGRRGIGTRLVRAVADWARAEEYSVLTLVTFRHLPWNAPFYEKLGFVSLRDEEIGAGIAALFRDEKRAGIDIGNRVCMQLPLTDRWN